MQQIFATREFLKTLIQQVHVKGSSRGGAPGGPHPSYFYIKLKNEKTEKILLRLPPLTSGSG